MKIPSILKAAPALMKKKNKQIHYLQQFKYVGKCKIKFI